MLGGFQELSENCELLSLSVDAFTLFFFLPSYPSLLSLSLTLLFHSFIHSLSPAAFANREALEFWRGTFRTYMYIFHGHCIGCCCCFLGTYFILLVECEVRTLNLTIFLPSYKSSFEYRHFRNCYLHI